MLAEPPVQESVVTASMPMSVLSLAEAAALAGCRLAALVVGPGTLEAMPGSTGPAVVAGALELPLAESGAAVLAGMAQTESLWW
jgi:hypothetical protein